MNSHQHALLSMSFLAEEPSCKLSRVDLVPGTLVDGTRPVLIVPASLGMRG